MGAAVLALTAVNAATDIYTSYTKSQAQKQQGQYEQQMDNASARIADLNAEDATERGNVNADRVAAKGVQVQGDQVAGLSGQGVDVNSGSPADLESDTGRLSTMDAMTVRNNAWREAWGYKTTAIDDRSQGQLARIGAGNAARNTLISGGLDVAKDVTGGVYKYSQA